MSSSVPLAGTPYHRLTHHLSRRRVLSTLLAVLIGTLVAPLPVALITQRLPPGGLPVLGSYSELVLSFAAIACILPTTLLIVRCGERRKVGTLSSVTGRLRWWWLALCVAIAGTCIVLAVCLGSLTAVLTSNGTHAAASKQESTWIGIGPYLAVLTILLCLIVGQVAAEEYVTRGVILQAIGRLTHSPWPAISVQAVVFTALHGAGGGWWGVFGVLSVGVALGWLTVRTGGLEAGIAFHLVQNGLVAVVAVAAGATDPTANATAAPWPVAVGIAATVTTYALITSLVARALGITSPPRTSSGPGYQAAPTALVGASTSTDTASTNSTDASNRYADH